MARHHRSRGKSFFSQSFDTTQSFSSIKNQKTKKKKSENIKRLTTFPWKTGLLLHTHCFCSILFPTILSAFTLLLSSHLLRHWIGHPVAGAASYEQMRTLKRGRITFFSTSTFFSTLIIFRISHSFRPSSELQTFTLKSPTAALDWAPSCWRGITWVEANTGAKTDLSHTASTASKSRKSPKKIGNKKRSDNIHLENGTSVIYIPLLQHIFRTSNLLLSHHSLRHWTGHPVLAQHHTSRCEHWSDNDTHHTQLQQHVSLNSNLQFSTHSS